MIKRCQFFLFFVLFLALVSPCAHSDERKLSLLKFQMESEQVLQLFGRPDRRVEKPSREVWYYDSSSVFFRKGRVVAWSSEKDEQADNSLDEFIQLAQEPKINGTNKNWLNPWTYMHPVPASDMVKEIMTP